MCLIYSIFNYTDNEISTGTGLIIELYNLQNNKLMVL